MIANCLNDKVLPVYGERKNVGDNNEMRIVDIVRFICHELGKPDSLITHVMDHKVHDMRYAIDRLRSTTSWGVCWKRNLKMESKRPFDSTWKTSLGGKKSSAENTKTTMKRGMGIGEERG